MLITKETEIAVNSRNLKHFEELGYIIPKRLNHVGKYQYIRGTKILVNVFHLLPTSETKVLVKCDYCAEENIETIVKKSWTNYLSEREYVQKDCCDKCKYKKYKDVLKYKQESNLLTPKDMGYWTFKENRLKALKDYIEKYGKVTDMINNKDGKSLNSVIRNYGETPIFLALELGYNIFDICDKLPPHYLDDWEKFKILIEMLINKFNRFPTQNEIITELKIAGKYILKHGGMYEIKRKLNYIDDGDLIDDLGYYNSSSYEYILSQWLIHNTDIKIDRNVVISPIPEEEGNYNCDFVLTLPNNKKIWIEIWGGYREYTTSVKFKNYNKKHDIKVKLYDKYNCDLISLYPNFFDNKKYDKLQEDIFNLLKNKITCKNKYVSNITKIIPYSLLNENELLEKVMSYSENKDILPGARFLYCKNERLAKEITKRYGNLARFGEHMGIKVKYKPNNYWTKERIFSIFNHMLNAYGRILNRGEIDKYKNNDNSILEISHIANSFNKKFKGTYALKIEFFEYCLNNNIKIPQVEINWLYKMSVNKTRRGNKLVSDEYQQLAKQILDKYNVMQNLSPAN